MTAEISSSCASHGGGFDRRPTEGAGAEDRQQSHDEGGSANRDLAALERTLLLLIPLIRRARRECLLVRERAERRQPRPAPPRSDAEEVTDAPADVVRPPRYSVGEFVPFSEDRFPGLVWASGWEVIDLITGEDARPAYRIRSPDQLRVNVVAESDLLACMYGAEGDRGPLRGPDQVGQERHVFAAEGRQPRMIDGST